MDCDVIQVRGKMTIFKMKFWLFLTTKKFLNMAFFLDKSKKNKYK